jgi:hypothetical protein
MLLPCIDESSRGTNGWIVALPVVDVGSLLKFPSSSEGSTDGCRETERTRAVVVSADVGRSKRSDRRTAVVKEEGEDAPLLLSLATWVEATRCIIVRTRGVT